MTPSRRADLLRRHAKHAVALAVKRLAAGDLEHMNSVSAITQTVSEELRKAILRESLELHHFNLTKAGTDLGLGATNFIRMLHQEEGLTSLLKEARRDGRITKAWNKGKKMAAR